MPIIRVIDIETTGTAPPAEIVELGWVDVTVAQDGVTLSSPRARLYRPLRGVSVETMAVHHLTEADFDDSMPVATPEALSEAILSWPSPDVLAAHNCRFERSFIPVEVTDPLPWICTFRTARRLWPGAPRHTNQVLRYWRGLTLDPTLAMPPHRAAPDAFVTANLLVEMLKEAAISDMIDWTETERTPPDGIPFGKHRGLAWADAPTDYLTWITLRTGMAEDIVNRAREELTRRAAPP